MAIAAPPGAESCRTNVDNFRACVGRSSRDRSLSRAFLDGFSRARGQILARFARFARLALTLFGPLSYRLFMCDTCCHRQPGAGRVPASGFRVGNTPMPKVSMTCTAQWDSNQESGRARAPPKRAEINRDQTRSNQIKPILTNEDPAQRAGHPACSNGVSARPVRPGPKPCSETIQPDPGRIRVAPAKSDPVG